MTILEDMYDLCDMCNVETEKAELEDGVCRGCRASLCGSDIGPSRS
jgi:hypothetical protein